MDYSYSVFEQFQFHWGIYDIESFMWWLDSLFFNVGFTLEMMASRGDLFSWIRVLRSYDAFSAFRTNILSNMEISSLWSVILRPATICSSIQSYSIVTFFIFFAKEVTLQIIWIITYLTSNWVWSVVLVMCFIWIIVLLWPTSVVVHNGRKGHFLVGVIGRVSSAVYAFFYELVYSYLKHDTKDFFPFIFYVFMFISIFNLCGMLPYSLAITSHLIMTCSIAVISWGGLLLCGVDYHGIRLLTIFYPKGLSFYLVPFICIIEIVSHVFRVVSLALRLFSNIVAGHILLDIVSIFLFKLTVSSALFAKTAILAFGMGVVLLLFFFECAICLLQGYIFAVLCCIYCRDYVQLTH